ncbi:DBND1 protein, partial [Polyodon spathula]|nr:DBND1 protein [Polyodon spathula]
MLMRWGDYTGLIPGDSIATVQAAELTQVDWMEAQGGAGTPELNKEALNLLKPSASGDLKTDVPHNPLGEEEGGIPFPNSGLLHVAERRQPLSSVSSLEVHFDLLDLTELTDMSDQELAEVFADSDEENQNESPANDKYEENVSSLEVHFDLLDLTELTDMSDQELAEVFADSDEENQNESPARYLRSPSWTRTKGEHRRDRKSNPSESEQPLDTDRPKKP